MTGRSIRKKLGRLKRAILGDRNVRFWYDPKTVRGEKGFARLQKGNRLAGTPPVLKNSVVRFLGKNNVLYCEEGVSITDSEITFAGDNALVFLSVSRHLYRLSLTANRDSVFYAGKDNYFNGCLNVILSERKHLFIGENGVFSFGIWVRNADPHLIYDSGTGQRLNPTKSIFIGDHVWVGQSAFILKGTQIDSGSIIGAMSVVSGKRIGHNSVWAGNPARKKADSVFWDGACVHGWPEKTSVKSRRYEEFIGSGGGRQADDYVYRYDAAQEIGYDELDAMMDGPEPMEKLERLISMAKKAGKNRFVHMREQ